MQWTGWSPVNRRFLFYKFEQFRSLICWLPHLRFGVAVLLAYGLQVRNGQYNSLLSAYANNFLCTYPKSELHEANDWKEKRPCNNFMCFVGCVLLGFGSERVRQLILQLYVSMCPTIFAKLIIPSHLPTMHTSKHHVHKSTQKLTCKGADRQALGLQVLCLCSAASKEGQVGPPRIACCQNRRKELCCLVIFGPVF